MSTQKSAMDEQFCKDEGKWYVTVFTENDEKNEEKDVVEAIPDFWLWENGEEAMWPPGKDQRKIIKAIESRKRPDKNWLICKVKTVYWTQVCKTYAEATTKADLAEDTSDFNEKYERLTNPANRKVYKRKILFSDDDDDENCNSKRERKSRSTGVPKVKNETKFRESSKNLPDPPQQILIDTRTNKVDLLSCKEAKNDSVENNENDEGIFSAETKKCEQKPQDEDTEGVPAFTPIKRLKIHKPIITSVNTVNFPLKAITTVKPKDNGTTQVAASTSKLISSDARPGTHCNESFNVTEKNVNQKCTPFGKSGIFSVDKLKSMSDRELMVHLTLLCQTMLTNQCREEVKNYAKSNQNENIDSLYELGMLIKQKFPLHTKEQFDAFNDHLKENEDSEMKFRRYFDTIGGKDGPAIARGILRIIIADSLGDLYSLKGQQDKLAFGVSKFYHILEAAAMNGFKTNN